MNAARGSGGSLPLAGGIADPATDMVPFRIDFSAVNVTSRIEQTTAALHATAPDDWGRRAALLATLAVAQSLGAPTRAADTLAEALSAAERAGTRTATIYTLMTRYAIDLSPEALPRRVEFARAALDLLASPDCADVRADLLPMAYFMYLGTLIESGDMPALDAALSPELHLADLVAQVLDTRYAVWFRCARAAMDGQLALAERLADDGRVLAEERHDVDADYVWAGQMAVIRWMQGRISELEPIFVQARRIDPAEPVWAAAVAWIWSHQGRIAAAQGLIESLPDINESPRGRNWLAAVAMLAEVATEIGSDDLVERLRRALLPFADRVVSAGLGVVCWGTAARPLALLARRQGRDEEARAHYRKAIALCSRIGAQTWLAQAQVELGALELDNGNMREARSLADESAAAAHHLGLPIVEEQAAALRERVASAPAVVDSSSAPAVADSTAAPRITVLGEFTVTPPESAPITWRSRKARILLQILVTRRGAPLSRETAMHLLWPDDDPSRLRNRLSVALTAVRRALDPGRNLPADAFVQADADRLRLRMDRVSVDVEDFLALAEAARAADLELSEGENLLRRAVAAYGGEVLGQETDVPWAEPLRRQAHLAFLASARALAHSARTVDDHLEQAELCRRILAIDAYDQQAHDGLIAALTELGANGHLAAARDERERRMAESRLPGFEAARRARRSEP